MKLLTPCLTGVGAQVSFLHSILCDLYQISDTVPTEVIEITQVETTVFSKVLNNLGLFI